MWERGSYWGWVRKEINDCQWIHRRKLNSWFKSQLTKIKRKRT